MEVANGQNPNEERRWAGLIVFYAWLALARRALLTYPFINTSSSSSSYSLHSSFARLVALIFL